MNNDDPGGVVIRRAQVSDAEGVARVLVETYATTYRGLIQDSTLEKMSIPGRSTRWEQVIGAQGDDIVLVAVREDQTVLAYAYGGPCREATLPDGQLYQFYVHPSAQGQGLGKRLFTSFARTLWIEGFSSMVVYVIDGNPAVNFYEKMGGIPTGSHYTTLDGRRYEEHAYRWPDLDEWME